MTPHPLEATFGLLRMMVDDLSAIPMITRPFTPQVRVSSPRRPTSIDLRIFATFVVACGRCEAVVRQGSASLVDLASAADDSLVSPYGSWGAPLHRGSNKIMI